MNDTGKASASASTNGGIGFLGMLVILGLLGVGPCADDCSGCGPTPADIYKSIKCGDD